MKKHEIRIEQKYPGIWSIFADDEYIGHLIFDPDNSNVLIINFDPHFYKSKFQVEKVEFNRFTSRICLEKIFK